MTSLLMEERRQSENWGKPIWGTGFCRLCRWGQSPHDPQLLISRKHYYTIRAVIDIRNLVNSTDFRCAYDLHTLCFSLMK